MNDIHSLTPCDYNNEKKDLSSLSIKRSRLDHHHHHQYQHHQSTELTSTSAKRAFITVEDNEEGEYNCTQDNILNTTTNYIDTGIKLTSNDEYQHHDLEKTSSSSSSSSPISTPTTIATHQTTSITVVNNSNSYINDENKDQLNVFNQRNRTDQINLFDDEKDAHIPSIQFQLNDHDSEDFTTEIDGSNGKLTLWQFLLELLLSNKYEHIIRWTNKRGEFILVQAEIVAKLWGMRKDKNHRMNYDKLSRALRYYYQKNIIRKVHGRKFVYQFIGLKNLIKFCCTSMNSTLITTSVTTSIITPTIVTSTLQQTLTPLNNLPVDSKIDDIDLPVTSSLYHTASKLNELYNHNEKQHQDWFYTPSHNTKFYENQRDCKHTTTSNTINNILNTITNVNNCTLTSTQTEKSPNLNCSTNNLTYFPNNLDITTITTFINSYLNKNNYETNTITNNNNNNNNHDNNNNNNDNNILLNHVGESISTLSDPSQIKASHEINDLSDFISSWVSMMSQSNYLNNFRLMECFKQSGSLLNLFNCHNIEQFNVDQEKQIYTTDTCCRIGQNNSILNKEKIITNITDNHQLMNNQNIDNCPVNLHANYHPDLMNNYDSELWKVEDFTQYEKDNPMNFTATNLKTSEKLQFKQYCNQDNRPRSPCCECSCHSQLTHESNHPLMQSIQHQINSSHLTDNNNIIEKLRDYSTKQSITGNSDELPTKLHNKRHSINMKRLGEQLTRLNHLNSTGNHSNNNLMFINKYSPINNNNLTKSNLMKDEQIANHNEDMNRNDYFSAGECKIPLTKNVMLSDSKMASNLNSSTVNTTYNNSRTDNTSMSSLPTLSMSENKCVWMPVPVTMLNSWFNLLSNIKGLNNNSLNQSNFMTLSSFSTSSSSSTSSSMSSASLSSTVNNN
ncbi:hypothetical protein MS3_00007349 [Schistosoma haematobium]|uniref:Uncharacterized protein n=1 Tax=Schistosoma haematobium TaxID=6185 RepID=A0A6A5DG53_SCHHA|nr:hypothetical protein MS3_00007349 [Schistosoma haematobium]KAH9582672.1 hypothetical protein MS3_00007349 [Schistosoma haematobium]